MYAACYAPHTYTLPPKVCHANDMQISLFINHTPFKVIDMGPQWQKTIENDLKYMLEHIMCVFVIYSHGVHIILCTKVGDYRVEASDNWPARIAKHA